MNKRNVFHQICKHAMSMENQAITEDGTACYRSPLGPCLIGALIDDKNYSKELELHTVENVVVLDAIERSGISIRYDYEVYLLVDIQTAHDDIIKETTGNAFKKKLRENLMSVAIDNNIPFPRFYKAIED